MKNKMKEQFMNYKPSAEVVRLYDEVLKAQEETKQVRPVVTDYQNRILGENQWKNTNEIEICEKSGLECKERVILNPEETYLMADDDARRYFELCHKAATEAGFVLKEVGYCPLLIAENEEREARCELLEMFMAETYEFHGITIEEIGMINITLYNKLLDTVQKTVGCYVKSTELDNLIRLADKIIPKTKKQ